MVSHDLGGSGLRAPGSWLQVASRVRLALRSLPMLRWFRDASRAASRGCVSCCCWPWASRRQATASPDPTSTCLRLVVHDAAAHAFSTGSTQAPQGADMHCVLCHLNRTVRVPTVVAYREAVGLRQAACLARSGHASRVGFPGRRTAPSVSARFPLVAVTGTHCGAMGRPATPQALQRKPVAVLRAPLRARVLGHRSGDARDPRRAVVRGRRSRSVLWGKSCVLLYLLPSCSVDGRRARRRAAASMASAQSLSGRLVNSLSGDPIAGAVVEVEGQRRQTTSGADGSFTFDGLPPGTYHLSCARRATRRGARR